MNEEIQNILIIDTETTGLHPDKGAKLIEIGALLYNIKHKKVLQTFSTFLPCDENPVQDINNIDPAWTQIMTPIVPALDFLDKMAFNADYLVAHNAQFDKKFIEHAYPLGDILHSTWVCTKNDFKWPVTLYRNRLSDICEAMGVPYVNAHRALNDCAFIASCFDKIHDLEQRFESAAKSAMMSSNKFR